MDPELKPRGMEAALPHRALPEVDNPYMRKLISETGGPTGPIGLQFRAQPELEAKNYTGTVSDPLNEDEHLVPGAPGLVYKYDGRALWTVTFKCAIYCRFCTRGREVGVPENVSLTKDQIDQTLAFIRRTPGLKEIILSGGDPLWMDPELLDYILTNLGQMQKENVLDFVRIGTRVPVHNPPRLKEAHYAAISKLTNPYLMVHINHPADLTPEVLKVTDRFRRNCDALVISQTVLLKGVNNNEETLIALFNKMTKYGIRPYYLYQNDPVYWATHFTVPFEEAKNLWQKLRPKLSGIAATARFSIDVPGGYGKIPVPEGDAWNVDYEAGLKDFKGTRFKILD